MRLYVINGSDALGIRKGTYLKVESQPEHQGNGVWSIRISWFYNGPHFRTLYARLWHNPEFYMNNGDPTKKIRVQRK